jgi:2'-5' RNA ligase
MTMTRPEPTRRLFFALWPDESAQNALAEATRQVVSESEGASVPARNFHFTLAFLGAVAESRIPDLSNVAARVAAAFRSVTSARAVDEPGQLADAAAAPRTSPILVTLDHIDHWRRSQVLCATSSTEPTEAIALAETLKSALTANGFAPDLKPFRAHATLARKVRRVTRERHMPAVCWSFHDFRLIESHTAPSGSIYSSREIYPLDMQLR